MIIVTVHIIHSLSDQMMFMLSPTQGLVTEELFEPSRLMHQGILPVLRHTHIPTIQDRVA